MILLYVAVAFAATVAVALAIRFAWETGDPWTPWRASCRIAWGRIAGVLLAMCAVGCGLPEDGPCLPGFTDACNVTARSVGAEDYFVICYNLQTDPNACGACGTVCASGVCNGGVCAAVACEYCPDGGSSCAPCGDGGGK